MYVFRSLLWVFLTLCGFAPIFSQGYTLDSTLKKAYRQSIHLQLDSSRATLDTYRLHHPDNMMRHLIDNYNDFLEVFISEEKPRFREVSKNMKQRLSLLREGDDHSPYHLYSIAEIYIQQAALRIKFEEHFSAARDIYTAYRLLEKNTERFPAFSLNKKSLSIIHALSESLPSWLRTITGVRGSIAQGIEEIQELMAFAQYDQEAYLFLLEAEVIHAYMQLYLNNNSTAAFTTLYDDHTEVEDNPLLAFFKAVVARHCGKNDLAIQVLENLTRDETTMPFYYLDFMRGRYLLHRLEEGADVYLKKYVDNFHGRHFVKEAYQKLAWYELVISEDTTAYKKYMDLTLRHGSKTTDEDKQALKEAQSRHIPHPVLLRSRLLYDGGYLNRALGILSRHGDVFSKGSKEYEEYHYRLARIYQGLEDYTFAERHYGVVMDMGERATHRCHAALNLGLIHENIGEKQKAREYYQTCLRIKNSLYKESLHQKAKAGLDRVGR